jgi:hypothetical protein
MVTTRQAPVCQLLVRLCVRFGIGRQQIRCFDWSKHPALQPNLTLTSCFSATCLLACSYLFGSGLWSNVTRTLVVQALCPAGEVPCEDGSCSEGECGQDVAPGLAPRSACKNQHLANSRVRPVLCLRLETR